MMKDTCSMVAVTLPMVQPSTSAMPVIWSVDKLPHDSYRLVAVPEPLGGTLVFSMNHLLYYNQNVFYGLALNEYVNFMSDISPTELGKKNHRNFFEISKIKL